MAIFLENEKDICRHSITQELIKKTKTNFPKNIKVFDKKIEKLFKARYNTER